MPPDPSPRTDLRNSKGVQVSASGISIQFNAFHAAPSGAGWGLAEPSPGVPARRGEAHAGWPLDTVTDPFDLEVQRPVLPDDPRPDLPLLPPYVAREHDAALIRVAEEAAGGRSGIAVLVGGSSTGKTRACWEALRLLRGREPAWRLWHPIDPSPSEAALRDLPAVAPRTVVWLNEAQLYLDTEDGQGERVAAGVRDLLRDPARAPVLVLATAWPSYWNELTSRPTEGPDRHAMARALLAGRDFPVPASFTDAELRRVRTAGDQRLDAAAGAEDRQVTQFLAGAPELLSRYRSAPPGARALISAAMDARRLGMRESLTLAFLRIAAPGYLVGAEPDDLSEDWLEQALAYAGASCKGARGPLTRHRPGLPCTAPGGGVVYRLAAYLDQYGRRSRRGEPLPQAFWAAAARASSSRDLNVLAGAASRRGLLLQAARLYKLSAAAGNDLAATALIRRLSSLHPEDQAPARWVAEHAALDTPDAAATLLGALLDAGADDPARYLADRAAANLPPGTPQDLNRLLTALRDAGTQQRATTPARGARGRGEPELFSPTWLDDVLGEMDTAEHVIALPGQAPASLGTNHDRAVVTAVLEALQAVTRAGSAATLANSAAAQPLPGKPSAAGFLLRVLQLATVKKRPGDRAAPAGLVSVATVLILHERTGQVIMLMDTDHDAVHQGSLGPVPGRLYARALATPGTADLGTARQVQVGGYRATERRFSLPAGPAARSKAFRDEQVTALLERAAAYATLDDLPDFAFLLDVSQEADAHELVTALLNRDPATHVPLSDAHGIARLLNALQEAGAHEQLTALLNRDPATHVPLSDAHGIARLLDALQEADAHEQLTALLNRDPATHVPLSDAFSIDAVLDALWEAGAHEQAAIAVGRLPAEGWFELFLAQGDHQDRYKFGREPDGSPAPAWDWKDLG